MPTVTPDFSAIKERFELLNLYEQLDWIVLPVCAPVGNGCCTCGRPHEPRNIGKVPLVPLAAAEAGSVTKEWLKRRVMTSTSSNVGVLLGRSKLLVIDADSAAAVEEVRQLGINEGPVASRGRVRRHFFFANPDGIRGRAIRRGMSGAIDILSAGFVVVPPSRHRSRDAYRWVTAPAAALPPAPRWALETLRMERTIAGALRLPDTPTPIPIAGANVSTRIQRLIEYGPAAEPGRYASRSEAIYASLLALIAAGYSNKFIAGVLWNEAHAIGEKVREKGLEWLAREIEGARDDFEAFRGRAPRRAPQPTVRVEVG